MLDLDTKPKLSSLDGKYRELLTKVDDYALDYNIFLFRGIHDKIANNDTELLTTIESLYNSIPDEYTSIIFSPLNSGKLEPSTTSRLQDRILSLLIEERHRRDIAVLNKQMDGKIKYIELEDPFKYEIKSIYHKTFESAKDGFDEQFKFFALLQCLEYDFEHTLDDDSDYQEDNDLIAHFCDDTLMNFKLEKGMKEEDVVNEEIVRVILPLASQVIMGNDDEEEDEEEEV